MDFGDILAQWDRQQRGHLSSTHNGKNASPTAHAKPSDENQARKKQAKEQMEDWLDKFGTIDKDAISLQRELQSKLERPSFLRSLKPQAQLDLHNLTQNEAWHKLDAFVTSCRDQGLKKVLIIHGKGNHTQNGEPVLGAMVRHFIECDQRLGEWGHPDRAGGGSGATWVIIKG